jgi:hypothetical protein
MVYDTSGCQAAAIRGRAEQLNQADDQSTSARNPGLTGQERVSGIGRAAPVALLNFLPPEQNTKAYRTYVLEQAARPVSRHRGKSPRQAGFFFRAPELRFQAVNLASLFVMYGLLRTTSQGVESSYRVGSLESGALLCGGYEAYRELHSPGFISFEHAWFLLLALGRRDEIALGRCAECGGVRLHDLLAKRGSDCLMCAPGVGLNC